MREALAARSDHDFIADPVPPRRPRAQARGRAAPRLGLVQRALALVRRYPLEAAIAVALAASVSAIAYNALALQTMRHPSPWFGRRAETPMPPARPAAATPAHAPLAAPAAAPATVAAPVTAPAPLPPRPATRDAIGDLIRAGDVAPAARPAPPAPPARPQTAARDPIGDMIRLGDPPPVPPALVGRPEARMTAVQTALARLGYLSGKPDGVAGPQTKQAIERFERERKLPVTGDLSPRTLKELTAASGVAVD